ncbi:LuxR C-terminal-related transcriptional regulator [Bacillus sp. FJAT-53711]|uniref:LuxR C-terminal-related transcriptional regulator n=1 Tax=Bacillus yunxiaonensis TaxID=3127665 RepID=A0ABU8FX01_9BACI
MKREVHIISTKLMTPTPRKNYVRREKLLKKLEILHDYKLVVVKGSAGSGKTTILSSFVKENPEVAIVWITLDKENNNVFSFWYYMLESLRVYIKEIEEIFSLFHMIMHKDDMKRIIVALINILSTKDDITIVIDDFHYITDVDVNKTMEYLLKHSSENIHIVLLTREEPNFYVGDFLISGRLLEIGEEELRFSADEGFQFIRYTLKMDLKHEVVHDMNMLAEGWIGGLQLIALARSYHKNDCMQNMKVLNKYMIAYLSKEILEALEEEEQDFLVKTSILSYFNEEICDELLGKKDTKEMIIRLFQKHLFMINIDEDRGIYRYHAIFQQFLQHCFGQLEIGVQKELRLRAAEVYERSGDFEECIKQLLEMQCYEAALRKIENHGQNPQGWSYLRHIPLTCIVQNKEMAFQLIFYHYCNMEFEQCTEILNIVYEGESGHHPWKVFEFCKALIEEENLQLDVLFINEIEDMDISDVTKAIIYVELSFFLWFQERIKDALYVLDKASMLEKRMKNPYVKMGILSSLCQIKEELGDLKECERLYNQLFEVIEQHSFLSALTVTCHIGITGIYLKRLQLEKAEKSLQHVQGDEAALGKAYLYNVMELQFLKGDKRQAKETIQKLQTFDAYQNELFISSLLKYAIHVDEEYVQQLDQFAVMYQQKKEKKKLRNEDKILYAQILLQKGNIQESLQLLDEIAEFTRKHKMKVLLIEALLLKVLILGNDMQKHKRELLNLLREAVHYSYENHILLPYTRTDKQIQTLLLLLKEERLQDLNERERKFLNTLLQLGNHDKENFILSNRELEVLKVLATGASNKKIGEQLCISISTVKTHIINIYSKLHVSNRVEAIKKATEEGIIK